MTAPPIAPYFPFPIADAQGRATQQFQNYWKTSIDQAVAAALAAQQAQGTADTAVTNAATAQETADTLEQLILSDPGSRDETEKLRREVSDLQTLLCARR
jgi:hypothetical protein